MAQSETRNDQSNRREQTTATTDENTDADTEATPLGRIEAYDGSHESLTFKGEIACDTLETVARHFVGLLDDVRLNVTTDGVYYRAVDSGNVGMGCCWLPADEWDAYECVSPGTGGLHVEDLYDATRQFGTGDVTVRVGSQMPFGDVRPSLAVADGGSFTGISNLHDPDSVRRTPDVPDLDFTTTATVADGNRLRAFAKAHTHAQKDTEVVVTASLPTKRAELRDDAESVLSFESSADDVSPVVVTDSECEGDGVTYTGDIEYDGFGVSGDVHPDVADAHADHIVVSQASYTARFLKGALGKLRKSDTENVAYTVRFASEYPLRLERAMAGDARVWFLLAPRITND